MQHLLANYFLQYKKLPLPTLGSLVFNYTPAESLTGQNALSAPIPTITLQSITIDTDNLLSYISAKKNISTNDAGVLLNNTVEEIKKLDKNSFFELKNVGSFSKNELNEIIFTPIEIEPAFLPNTTAIRVVHPNETHSMLVGETKTNAAAMHEYYDKSNKKIKVKWWIFALVAFAMAAAAIVFSYINNAGNFFRNNNHIEINKADSSYKKLR